jgi:hypothetical protein
MKSPSSLVRSVVDGFAADEPGLTMLMAALPNHHGGGGLEWGSKASAQSRHEDGEVRSEAGLLKALSGPLRKLMKELGVDPKVSNAAVVAFRTDAGLAITVLLVGPGDVGKGEWAGFASHTEDEWLRIANGPKPERYPYSKMPQPVGTVVGITADGSLGEPVRTVPPHMEWFFCPIDWSAVAGVPADMVIPDPVPEEPQKEGRDGMREDGRKLDPFIENVVVAIAMQPPGIRDIRRIGVPNGFRGPRGEVVE